ncbi:hypothetical protein I553_1464 [Mycobacterium xenopi 4042]|uniref:Uncharacterized protein n=1 Tax=Mycobacterium xenopi 4042 TaxID=1299334 RepID=X8CGU1_MYCXE|nr:hypothetical protein I553_1464 [Mycobacterium xenopi 4042]
MQVCKSPPAKKKAPTRGSGATGPATTRATGWLARISRTLEVTVGLAGGPQADSSNARLTGTTPITAMARIGVHHARGVADDPDPTPASGYGMLPQATAFRTYRRAN